MKRNVIIMGAAGRDFHNFNVFFRNNDSYNVAAFTAAQIPDIDGRVYPPALAGSNYPNGIPIYAEDELERLIKENVIDEVVFAYSDIAHVDVMHKASRVLSCGADFTLMGPRHTMLTSKNPVVSVGAVRTGVGKSQTTRKVAAILKDMGYRVGIVRHPMPYGNLEAQICQRFATLEDLEKHKCTIEEAEEFAPHIERGNIVYAGVDYKKILEAVEAESDIILWDGGNNDIPFYKSDFHITLVDPHRVGHEGLYHPGETNLRMADVVIINKIDTATKESVEALKKNISTYNSKAKVLEAASPVSVDNPSILKGAKVLVIEDGPTLTHGDMGFGAGIVASKAHGAKEILDPRPYAVGSIKEVYRKYPHLDSVLPAMGYSKDQVEELRKTIEAVPCDVVVIGTPYDLRSIMSLSKPAVRVTYELDVKTTPGLEPLLSDFLKSKKLSKV